MLKRRSTERVQVARIAATTIEQLVQEAIEQHRLRRSLPSMNWWQSVQQVVLASREIKITLVNQLSEIEKDLETLSLAVNFKKRGSEMLIIPAPGSRHDVPLRLNRPLIRAVIRAHQWRSQLESGAASSIQAIASAENVGATYIGKLLLLAFLAPDLTDQILEGRQPPMLMIGHIRTKALPMDWPAQRRWFASFNG